MAAGNEEDGQAAEGTAATGACADFSYLLPRVPSSPCARSTASGGEPQHEPSGLCGLLQLEDSWFSTLGKLAQEQPGDLPEAIEFVPRVTLRMKYPVVALAGGGDAMVTASSSPMRKMALQLADARKALNCCRVTNSKERRELEAQLRRCKEVTQSNHRELDRRLCRAEAAAADVDSMFKDAKRRASTWRRLAHKNTQEVKRLRAALDEARCSDKKHMAEAAAASASLDRQTWKLDKLTARLESEKSSYRVRAADGRRAKLQAKENVCLQEAAKDSQVQVEAAQAAARAALHKQVALQEELAQAGEARLSLEQRLAVEAQKAQEAQHEAQQAALEVLAEQDKSASLAEARDALLGELVAVRKHADTLATCAAALTAPKYRDVTGKELSYRSKCRAHQEDKDFLMRIFSERAWRGDDVASVLHAAGLLPEVFASSEVCQIDGNLNVAPAQ